MMALLQRFLVVSVLPVMLTITSIHLTPLDVYVPEIEQMLNGFRFAWSHLTTFFNTLLPTH